MATATEERNRELVEQYLQAWEEENPDAVPGLLADDFSTTDTDPTGSETEMDVGGFREMMAGYFEVFGDYDHEVHEMVAEGDRVIVRLTWRGVHEAEYLGVDPTGTRVEVEEYLSFRIADGEIVEMDWLADDLALLRQLGVDLPIEA